MPISVRPAIPAAQIVSVVPSVLAAGGNALDLIGLILTLNTEPPIGEVLSFADATDVASYFGPTSGLAALASIYFNGPDNATALPAKLLVAQYPLVAVNAYLRGGSVSGMSLASLQALSGTVAVTINGTPVTSSAIDLSTATSFSSAAILIWDGLGVNGPGGASATGSIAGTVLTVSAISSGMIEVGHRVAGTGVTADTVVVSLGTGTGGIGTYNVNIPQTALSEAITTTAPSCYYDPIAGAFVIQSNTNGVSSTIGYAGSGAFTNALGLTAATGAVISQGSDATDPTTFMNNITTITQDWASFMTAWEPTDTVKEGFATWTNAQRNRYVYEMVDTSETNLAAGGPSPVVAFINDGGLSGISMIYEDPNIDTIFGELAAFEMGWTASLDFPRQNGRQTAAFKSQAGLAPQVFDGTKANYLKSYGLNFYGDYTTANQAFTFYNPGTISGKFLWKDTYVNQIWLNNQLQLAIMVGLVNTPSIPYNTAGYTLIESFTMDPINEGVNFGAIVAGVQLSAAQIQEVNNSAGLEIADILSQRGWYLQIRPAIAQVRQARTSPPCTLWYCDGGAVQELTLSSITVQ